MSSFAHRRLKLDFKHLQENTPPGVSACPSDDNILLWYGVIFGPTETMFEDGTFQLKLQFTEEYPNKPPVVHFLTKIFHPNVYADGRLCLDILDTRWSSAFDVSAILISILSLLDDPNPQSPANAVAANLYCNNRLEYKKLVRQCVNQSYVHVSFS